MDGLSAPGNSGEPDAMRVPVGIDVLDGPVASTLPGMEALQNVPLAFGYFASGRSEAGRVVFREAY